MFYKGVIFDLDDTIYNQNLCSEKSYQKVDDYLTNKYNVSVKENIEEIKYSTKRELHNTASSHNRFIYFKKLVEKNNLPYFETIKLNNLYWETFYNSMSLFEGVLETFKNLKNWGVKIIILTDFQTEYQLKKLETLNILDYIDYIVTSEEIGIEKPSFRMFDAVVNITGFKKEELIMIGDNYEKDFLGGKNYGIYSFHFKNNFNSFNDMLSNLSKDVNDFSDLCNSFGKDFNLVQLGGGNISVKSGDWMIIKSSGLSMKDVNTNRGYSIVNNKKLTNDIIEDKIQNLSSYLIFNQNKPSIETYMHALLKKYTVHLHPIDINKILVRKDASDIIKKNHPDSLIIDYISPGIEIAKKILESNYKNINIIFLLNHGVIYTSDNLEEIYKMIKIDNRDYLCEDVYLNSNLDLVKKYYNRYAFPDAAIYLKDNYYMKDDKIYMKDRKYEEILKANIMILQGDKEINFLTETEIRSLLNREDEKYRKNLTN